MRLLAILAALAVLPACAGSDLETSKAWSKRMQDTIQPGQSRAEIEAMMSETRYAILDEPADRLRPPRSLTKNAFARWHLLVVKYDRVGCTEERHMYLRFGPDDRLEERIARGFVGCT